MFLEGCRWEPKDYALAESEPKVLFVPMPIIWFKPCEISSFKQFLCYNCPLYKTPERRGVLSTTGHSTNFVLDIRLPTILAGEHWIKRGVALLCSLSEWLLLILTKILNNNGFVCWYLCNLPFMANQIVW